MNEQLKIIISAETAKLKQGVNQAKAEIQSFKQKVDSVDTSTIDNNFQKLGGSIKTALKGASVALAGIATALVGTAVATEEYRVNQAKLNTAFEMAGAKAGTAQKVYSDLYKTLGDSDVAVEAANHLAQMTTNEKDLAEWTTIATGVYATFGDSLPIEGLTESANETAKVGQVTGSLADALNWAGISEDEFNKKLAACNSEQERTALIQDTLMGKYAVKFLGYVAPLLCLHNGLLVARHLLGAGSHAVEVALLLHGKLACSVVTILHQLTNLQVGFLQSRNVAILEEGHTHAQ